MVNTTAQHASQAITTVRAGLEAPAAAVTSADAEIVAATTAVAVSIEVGTTATVEAVTLTDAEITAATVEAATSTTVVQAAHATRAA